MSFKKLDVEELIILKEKEICMDKVNEIFKFENNGTILIIDEKNIFKGIITLGDYKRAVKNNEEVQINSNCKYFKQGQDTIENLSELSEKYPNIMMLPVLSENGEILYGIDMKADKYINSELERENYLWSEWGKIKNEENFEDILQSYIEYKGYNNIAIFGVSKFVLNFADDVNRVNKVIRNIYDYNNKEMYCKRLYLANYDTEVKLIDDIDELIEKHSTIIFLNEKYYSRNMAENLVFLKDFIEDLKRNYRFEYYKNNLNQLGVKLFKVGMPSTLDFIKAKVKINNFNIKEFFENNEGTPTIEEYGNFVNFTIRTDGVRVCTDCNTEGVNIIEGRRLTLNQPKIFKNTIYLFGPCIIQGAYANDENTVGTNLQKLINKIGLNYRVEAIPIGGQGRIEWICALRMIDKLNIKKGDKLIFVDQSLEFNYDIDLNMYEEFLKLYREEPKIFLDSPMHCGPKGCKKLAESIFYKLILNNKEFEESICEENNLNFDRKIIRNFDFLDRNKIRGGGA